MSFFEDASLVLIPSAIKDQKVYSIKPTDGTGDLTFSRASSATRVASNGLIEKVRTNLALYSEDQSNWSVSNAVNVSNNVANNPLNGALTADKVIPTIATDDHYRGLTMATMVGEITASIYVKADGYDFFDWGIFNNTASNYPVRAIFNLSTQAITFVNGSDASITSVGSGWYRVSITASIASSSSIGLYHRVKSSTTTGTYSGNGTSGMLLWGCQLENGVMTDYVGPTTTTAVSVGPVSGLPRLDYLNSSCPRLLLEPQRSNVFLQSEAIDNAAWGAARYTRTANQTASPTGIIDADLCTPTATSGTHEIFPATGISFSATAYTMSIFAKYDGYNISLGAAGASTNWTGCVFDLQNGIAKTPQSAGSQSVCTAKIENYGNGWYRCSITFTPYTTPTFYPTFGAVDSANATLGAWGAQSFTANGTSGAYLWGAQLEAGAYATSYIPTLGTSVTRVADACSKTGISSLIGQTEGVLFIDVNFDTVSGQTNDPVLIYLKGATAESYIEIIDNGRVDAVHFDAGLQCLISSLAGAVTTGRNKIAFAYKSSDFALYVNGVLVGTDLTGNVGTQSEFGFQYTASFYYGQQKVNQALLFKTRLTNAQLAELTTL